MRFSLPGIALSAIALLSSSLSAQCTMTSYGQGCGPTLTGTVTSNGGTERVTFEISNAQPRALVLFMLGFNELDLAIPGTAGCALLTDLAFSQMHQVDATGFYSWSRALPNNATGPAIRVQYLEITLDTASQLLMRTTNGVVMACP